MIRVKRLIEGVLAAVIIFNLCQSFPLQSQNPTTISFEIKNYEVFMGSQLYSEGDTSGRFFYVMLLCSGSNGELLSIVFTTPTSKVWENEAVLNSGPIHGLISAPAEQYIWYLDALRNEKCFVTLDGQNPRRNRLHWASLVGWGHAE